MTDEQLYAASMIHDEWLIGTDCIGFDTDGYLVNGQHRLDACVAAGKSFDCFVMRGLQPRARLVTDDNRKRTFADDLTMNGYKNGTRVEALLRKVIQWEDLKGIPYRGSARVPRLILDQRFTGKYKPLIHAIGITDVHMKAPINRGTEDFIVWLLLKNGPEDMVHRFLQILSIGSLSLEDEAVIKLREKFETDRINNAKSGKKSITAESVYFLIQAWNSWVTRKKVGKYRLPDGGLRLPFPEPVKVEHASK